MIWLSGMLSQEVGSDIMAGLGVVSWEVGSDIMGGLERYHGRSGAVSWEVWE